jgi:hypothetical protein
VADECGVIFRVNKGEFALGEGYFAEGEAVSQAAVKENRPERYAFEPRGNFQFDGKFDKTPLPTMDERRWTTDDRRRPKTAALYKWREPARF